jgi:thymidylate synthase
MWKEIKNRENSRLHKIKKIIKDLIKSKDNKRQIKVKWQTEDRVMQVDFLEKYRSYQHSFL